jgi:hypothetical protein
MRIRKAGDAAAGCGGAGGAHFPKMIADVPI